MDDKFNCYRYYSHLLYITKTVGILGWVVSGSNPNDFISDIYNNGKFHVYEVS